MFAVVYLVTILVSLSARRAWIEMAVCLAAGSSAVVALRKESVDRNPGADLVGNTKDRSLSARRAWIEIPEMAAMLKERAVALRKESVDRNPTGCTTRLPTTVALRKESVDRNITRGSFLYYSRVALRKESVDRNKQVDGGGTVGQGSLSARRAWIEIICFPGWYIAAGVALRKESVDRNIGQACARQHRGGRSPQGERG